MIGINATRLRESFASYSSIGETKSGGLHRLALTDADKKIRDRFIDDLEEIGLDIRVDRIGNIFGRREGAKPESAPVLIGSHLDSQPYGGRYDGQLGVLAALETVRTIEDEEIEPTRPVEIVNWTNEEGSRFQHAMLGSAVFTGETSVKEALDLTDNADNRLGDELERIGYNGSHPAEPFDIHSHVELHVEQGPTLADTNTSVGIVEGVFGIAWLRVTINGEADHAGPTPMHTRADAMATAADAAIAINRLPTRLSSDAVTTVGEFDIEPNSINIVPDTAKFTVDVRSYDDDVVDQAVTHVREEVAAACHRHRTDYNIEPVWRIPPTAFDPEICDVLELASETADVTSRRIVSGAGHDAKYINGIAPTSMIFVPSEDGKAHNENEFTEWDDCVAGAEVLADATVRLAKR
jgi:N-carbamoyl-L-amino-acid hydrolase